MQNILTPSLSLIKSTPTNAKFLALIAIWWKGAGILREWAYAGLFFLLLLATSAHLNAGDGEQVAPIIVLVVAIVSYVSGRKMDAE